MKPTLILLSISVFTRYFSMILIIANLDGHLMKCFEMRLHKYFYPIVAKFSSQRQYFPRFYPGKLSAPNAVK